jgi:hypothetical protein
VLVAAKRDGVPMLNWNDVEKARSHREELLREAASARRAREVEHPRQRLSPLVAPLVAAHRWLHELDAVGHTT